MRYLEKVGLGDAAHVRPSELSQGMQQRVGIARAFALAPRVLLLDEPFGMLDSLTRVELQEVLLDLWRAERTTALMVTHDVDEALFLADRVALMTNGPDARLGAVLTVPFSRPRERHEVMAHPAFFELREEIMTFLETHAHQRAPRGLGAHTGTHVIGCTDAPDASFRRLRERSTHQAHGYAHSPLRLRRRARRRARTHGRRRPRRRRRAAPPPAPAPAPKAAEPIKVTPYGIAYFNFFSNSDAVNNGDVPLFAAASGPGHTGMTARQSRLGIRVTGATVGKAKVTGVVEGDFFGGYPAVGIGDNMGVFRLRLANARLDWAKGSLVVGQDWMIFAPVNPLSLSSAGIPLFAAGGNLWSRLPQVRGEWKTKKVLLQGGVLAPQTGDFNSAFFYQPGSGALSETPFLQGRAAVTLANFAASKKVATIGVSGHWGQSRVLTPRRSDARLERHRRSTSCCRSAPRSPCRARRSPAPTSAASRPASSRAWSSTAPSPARAASPVLDGPRALDSAGGWVQVLAAVTPTVTVHGGFGTDDPDDADFLTVTRRESRLENTAISFGFQHKASAQHRLGRRVPPPRHEVPHRRRQGRRPRQRRLHVHVLERHGSGRRLPGLRPPARPRFSSTNVLLWLWQEQP